MFKRLICCIKGHAPFPERKVTPPPPPDPNTILIGGPGTYLSTNGLGHISYTPSQVSGLTVSHGPFEGTMRVCHRCHGIYWSVDPKASLITPQLKELDDYIAWRNRDRWETEQRKNNPLAEKLYNQYQVALKLAQPSDNGPQDSQSV